MLEDVIEMSGAGASLDLDTTACSVGSGACDVKLASIYPYADFNGTELVRDRCPASCRASEWFIRHTGAEFPCANETVAPVASLYQNYLPELALKYANTIAVSGTATPGAPFIVSEIEPDIRSTSLRSLDCT